MELDKIPLQHTKMKSKDNLPYTYSANFIGPGLESKFDELKYEITDKIDKQLVDSANAREYITQKYDELNNKLKSLTELDATVTCFRTSVKSIENQLIELTARVDDIEKRTIYKENPSITSAMINQDIKKEYELLNQNLAKE